MTIRLYANKIESEGEGWTRYETVFICSPFRSVRGKRPRFSKGRYDGRSYWAIHLFGFCLSFGRDYEDVYSETTLTL